MAIRTDSRKTKWTTFERRRDNSATKIFAQENHSCRVSCGAVLLELHILQIHFFKFEKEKFFNHLDVTVRSNFNCLVVFSAAVWRGHNKENAQETELGSHLTMELPEIKHRKVTPDR